MPAALQILVAAIGGGVLSSVISAVASRKKVDAEAVHVITQAAAMLVKSYEDTQRRLEEKIERAEDHAVQAVAEAYLARKSEDECKDRLTRLEARLDKLNGKEPRA